VSAAWVNRLKDKWGIESKWQFAAILITFTLAGLSITRIRRIFWPLLGFSSETSMWIQVPVYILLIFPTYQIMLMIFGTLLGQFKFFLAKEKAMLKFFARPFRKKESTAD
jgi:glucan phosphoethanolaminetransferase (alkaline phosphatase superfamily)